jgi:regulator of sirC expression with transglutaminase-like and TPR domain
VNRRALLLALGACACRGARAPSLSFARAALGVAHDASEASPEQQRASIAELTRIAELAEQALRKAPHAAPDGVLSELLFGSLGFVREVTDTSLGFVLLPGVLRERRGSCVGLGTLFLSLAEALGWSGSGVMMPGHFYVRVQSAPPAAAAARNVELLHRGESLPDSWYAGRFPIPPGGEREYGRPLSTRETLGVLHFDVGNERRRQRRFAEARRAYAASAGLFPDFAEAHASLGATLQVLGELDQAALSYQHALRANPALAGLSENMALLDAERARSR